MTPPITHKLFIISLLLFFVSACGQKQETSHSETLPAPNEAELVSEDEPPIATESSPEVHSPSQIPDLIFTGYPIGFLNGKPMGKIDTKDAIPVNIYNAPNGEKVSQLRLVYGDAIEGGLILLPEGIKFSDLQASNSTQYYKTGYDFGLIYLNYYATKGGFIQILAEGHPNYWIDYQDISNYFEPLRFIEDIAKRDTWQIYGYNNYRMRKSPSLEGEIIVKLDEKKHVIKKFTKIEGNWAEALVYEVNTTMDGCYSEEELDAAMTGISYTGWIRIVDEHGQISDINFYGSC